MLLQAILVGIEAIKHAKVLFPDEPLTLEKLLAAKEEDPNIEFLAAGYIHLTHSRAKNTGGAIFHNVIASVKDSVSDKSRSILIVKNISTEHVFLLLYKEAGIDPIEIGAISLYQKGELTSQILETGIGVFAGVTIINLTHAGKSESGPLVRQKDENKFVIGPVGESGDLPEHSVLEFIDDPIWSSDNAAVKSFLTEIIESPEFESTRPIDIPKRKKSSPSVKAKDSSFKPGFSLSLSSSSKPKDSPNLPKELPSPKLPGTETPTR